MRNAVLAACLAFWVCGASADAPVLALHEMDMHLHAGLERRLPMNEWLDLAAAQGRKAVLLLDHLELYRQTPDEYVRWAAKDHLKPWYAMGAEGHRQLFADFDQAAAGRKDLLIFRGWEIAEFELDEGLETAPMALAEVIGWHISPHHQEKAPDGRLLLRRIEQVKNVQKQFPVPMILFHPFSMRLEHLDRKAKKAGKDLASLPPETLRFFTPAEQNEVIRVLKNTSIYIEMPLDVVAYWDIPAAREAIIADVKPLADAGVKFTVSTDAHGIGDQTRPFQPERYCEPCGITPDNANALLRELLARRAKQP